MPPAPGPRVLHVNDAASTTHQLLSQAQARGLDWRYLPLAASGRTWTGRRAQLTRSALGAVWLGRLAAASARADLLHVHGGTVVRHTGWVPRRFVLHLHGTDIRSHQYDPRQRSAVLSGLRRAAAVLYSTPDLAEHVLGTRPDAQHFPQPLDLASLPVWSPPQRPLVLFASRWEDVKGLAAQLAVARDLRTALPADVRVAGLDWGPGAGAAAAAGVELLPRRPRAEYLALLAGASVVVGQSSGMLAASELEAMAIGVPVAASLRVAWYPLDPPPVLVGAGSSSSRQTADARAAADPATATPEGRTAEAVVDAVTSALVDPIAASAALDAPAWVARHHDVRDAVDRLVALYAGL